MFYNQIFCFELFTFEQSSFKRFKDLDNNGNYNLFEDKICSIDILIDQTQNICKYKLMWQFSEFLISLRSKNTPRF